MEKKNFINPLSIIIRRQFKWEAYPIPLKSLSISLMKHEVVNE